MTDRMLSAAEVVELIGCGRSTFYKWIKADRFPRGIKINGLRKWWQSTVMAHINGGAHPVQKPPVTPFTPSSTPATTKPKRMRLAKHVKPKDHSK